MVFWIRLLVVLLLMINVSFVVWEITDYRSADALGNSILMFIISLFCAAVTFVSTEDLRRSR
jgi:hypothetical protein